AKQQERKAMTPVTTVPFERLDLDVHRTPPAGLVAGGPPAPPPGVLARRGHVARLGIRGAVDRSLPRAHSPPSRLRRFGRPGGAARRARSGPALRRAVRPSRPCR